MAKQSSSNRTPRVDKRWRRILRMIPNYDPFAITDGYYFEADKADFAIEFFARCLKHVKGAKAHTPFNLEEWQQAIIGNLYGWLRIRDDLRRYREAFIYIPRKNGKTTMAAGLINLTPFIDDEPGAELYSAAGSREQARLVFAAAKGMVENDPDLFSRAMIYVNAIVYPNGVSYKPLSAEAGTSHGLNTHLCIIDELHAQPNRELVDVIITSTGAREQPLIVSITTADYDRESICNEKYEYACKVRDNGGDKMKDGYDPEFLPVIYEASKDDDWTDPATWAKANPNLDISIKREYIERECRKAQEIPAYENTFKRFHLNLRTEQEIRLIPMDQWDGCNAAVDREALRGCECYAGLDLASTDDLCALVLLFESGDDKYDMIPFFWLPKETMKKRSKRDKVPYEAFARAGLVELTPGNATDYRYIRTTIQGLQDEFQIVDLGFDPWNASMLAQQLIEEDGFNLTAVRQGMITLNEPTKVLLRWLLQCSLRHGGHKVLRWNAQNVAGKTDAAGNVKPDKEKSADKIDGISALVIAIERLIHSDDDGGPSVYETRGMISV